jgi:hypothetical protein
MDETAGGYMINGTRVFYAEGAGHDAAVSYKRGMSKLLW